MVGGLMIPSDEDGEHWSLLLPTVVLVEGLHQSVLGRGGHAVQVTTVTHGLGKENAISHPSRRLNA